MIFTGQELTLKRNFYTQTGCYGFVMSATVDTATGAYYFGLSGNGGVIDFRLESGRIYYSNQFVHSYKPFEEFTIEAQFSSGHTNVLKNDSPLVYGMPKATGHYDYFYFTRGSTDMGGEFDVNISGNNAAIYSITQQGYLFASGQNSVTGWFTNQSEFPIHVFNSAEQSSVIYEFGTLAGNIPAGASGAFTYSGDYETLDFSQPILTTFATNYGDAEILFSIIDARSYPYFVQITAPTDFGFNVENVLNRDVSYLNYSGGLITDGFDTRLTFLLGYVSGSGYFTTLTGYSVPGYGNFVESGNVTGWVDNVTGSYPITGSAWATGAATGFFSGVGTGIVSGIGYTGLGTGYMTGLSTGFIRPGSGTLTIDSHVGRGVTSLAIGLTGQIYATGYLDLGSLIDGDSFQIIVPNGTDYEASPLARITCNYLPLDPADCLFDDPQAANTDFPTATDLIECLSGFADIGINGTYDGGDLIYFTATTIGTVGNGIAFTGTNLILPGTGFTTGGHDGYLYAGTVAPVGQPFTGSFPLVVAGSGSYVVPLTGLYYLPYAKTFTGSWQFATGTSASTLVTFVPVSDVLYSGSGIFPPNSSVNIQVTYIPSGATPDGAYLIVTGDGVVNGINQILTL
jgi:hypothetical protein